MSKVLEVSDEVHEGLLGRNFGLCDAKILSKNWHLSASKY